MLDSVGNPVSVSDCVRVYRRGLGWVRELRPGNGKVAPAALVDDGSGRVRASWSVWATSGQIELEKKAEVCK